MVSSHYLVLFKVLFWLGCVWFLSVASLKTTTTLTLHEADLGSEKLGYDHQLDLNYMMSKRKVPNGPDPIHNRRAGNSKRPPGRV
ncbi:CLAVATA3/ESR (CLE)-related protein 25 [Mercurialis annua]|uniref:CLAVATA3/ESR (CLE)-related protein 25 n=1 Tax=Mercurialis annua TaxID=3986 RepID=UPI0021602940|nr:CLAVATA3/ESR (CLE)-related protein 25 [Mercurialis annua]